MTELFKKQLYDKLNLHDESNPMYIYIYWMNIYTFTNDKSVCL